MKVDAIGSVKTFEDTGIDKNPVDAGNLWEETKNSILEDTAAQDTKPARSVEQLRNEFADIQRQRNDLRDQALKIGMAKAVETVPDDEARINELAGQFNAPVDMVRNYRPLFEAQARNRDLDDLQRTNPKTADFLSDPNHARIAHDDIENIKSTERHIKSIWDFPVDAIRSLAAGLSGGTIKGIGGAASTAVRAFPVSGVIDESMINAQIMGYDTGKDINARVEEAVKQGEAFAKKTNVDAIYNTGKKWQESIRGDVSGYGLIGRGALSGFESLGAMIPGFAATVLTRNPVYGLTSAGLMEGSESVMEDLKSGKSLGKAILHGMINSSIEVGTEAIPMGKLIGDLDAGKKVLQVLIRNWIRETPSEMVATAGQTLSDKIFDMKAGDSLSDTIDKWAKELPEAEAQTVIATMVMSFGLGSTGVAARRIQAKQMADAVAGLNDDAKASKLRGRSKQVYEALVSTQTEGTPLENAYINSDRWQTYFQESGLDPKQQAELYGVTNYDEAIETGSDMVIPFPKYQSGFSASEHSSYFVSDTKLSEKGMTLNEQQAFYQRMEEQAKETDAILEQIGKESESARAVNDVLSRLTDEIAIQLEPRYDKKTARTLASVHARASFFPIQRDVIERAKEQGKEISPDEMASQILDSLSRYGLTINPNATPTTVNTRKNVDPAIDSMLERLRKNDFPKERDVYGMSLMEYIRKKGGIRPNDIVRNLVKNKQLPRSIVNTKGMGADELASLPDVLDYGFANEQTQSDDALLDALVNEYTTGEKRYSASQINNDLLSDLQSLNTLSNDLVAAGIDLNTDNVSIREALSKYYEGQQNGKDTGKESQAAEADRYEQRGFTESAEPTEEERSEANRQYDEVEQQYRNTDQWMKAPNGEPTKLTERQWVQVRTPNFKNWFGDWENDPENASKVVDENGEPRVFWHGTNEEIIEIFKSGKKLRKASSKEYSPSEGIWFAESKGFATDYGWNEIPVFLSIKNPLDLRIKENADLAAEETKNKKYAEIINEGLLIDLEKKGNTIQNSIVRWAKKQGYDGIVTTDWNRGYDYLANVAFESNQIKSAIGNIGTFSESPNILYQGADKVRGATVINPDRTMRIELFKDADYSTFVHETAHYMLEVYGDLASDPNASAYIRNEYATIRKYLGAKDGEAITREQHEKFARSFEAYLMEGKAPSPELQGIFSRFKTWLLNIYRSMRGLRVNLNKDIRETFDRMLASDEEIAIMRDASELQPLFATAEKMGIAQDEFDAYREIAEKELIDAQDRFRQKVMKAKLREKTKEYKEELEAEKKRVEKEYDRDPVVSAFNDLTSGEGFSLNEDALVRVYGKAFLLKLPKRNGNRIYSKDGNVLLEDLAESLDFNSGDALIQAIAQLPDRKSYIEDKARQNILDREGDVLNSDTIVDEAEDALHNEYMEARMKKELAILNRLKRAGEAAKRSERLKQAEKQKIIRQQEKEAAKNIEKEIEAKFAAMQVAAKYIISNKPVNELKPGLYLRAMQVASRRAIKAFNSKNPDYTESAKQKQIELMNNLLYKEASRVKKEINRRTLQAKSVVRKPLKDAVKTRDSLFVNRAKYIAAKLGLGGNADVIMERIRTEEKNRQDVEPFQYDISAPLRELNTATALDMLEDVKANWDQARRDKVMIVDGKRVEIDEAAKLLSDKLDDFGKTWRSSSSDDSLRNMLLKKIGNIVVDQTRIEAWCDMVDGASLGDETGPWMKYVFNPIKEAANKTRISQAEYTKRLTEIIDGFHFTRETIEAPELGYTFGKDTGYGKAELIHAILHTGNMSNFQRLLVGRGWGSILNGQVNAVKWNAFMSRMIAEGRITEKDMDGVQKIWDLFEELKPQSQKAHKEVFGRYFDEITATPFFEFGKRYAGGYVPAIYDSRESGAGEKQLDPTKDLINTMGTSFPRLQAGWGNTRKEGNFGPLLLDLSRIGDHINRQILFSNMAPVNADVSRLLNRKNVTDSIRGYDPEFLGTVIKPWMSRAVTQNLEASSRKQTPYDKISRELRMRAGAITMFGNVVNAIEQIFDMTAAYSKVKSRYLTDAFKTMVSDKEGTVKYVMDSSVYMRGRMSAEILAANGRMEQALRPGKLKKIDRWLIDHAYFMQMSVDNFCGPLTWIASYNQATESGLSHSDAVLQADSVVRQVFGANAAEDISNFESGTPMKRLFTQFTGYFVQRANLIAGEYSKIQRSDIANKKAAAAILLLQVFLLPALIGAALRKFAAGSDDDETFSSWLLDVFGWGTFNYGLSMGGHAGQIANVALDWYRGKSFSSGRVFYPPAFSMIENAFKFRKWEDSNGDFDVSKFVQDMAEIERIVPGLPIIPARPFATAKYIYDVVTDEIEPTGVYDFVRGVVTGRASADSK